MIHEIEVTSTQGAKMSQVVEGIKLIRHNVGGVNRPDDPSYPFRLDATFRPPEFMDFAFVSIHGGSEFIQVRGQSREALEQFIELNELRTHPRLIKLKITEPEKENTKANK